MGPFVFYFWREERGELYIYIYIYILNGGAMAPTDPYMHGPSLFISIFILCVETKMR